jgi:MFS family permease
MGAVGLVEGLPDRGGDDCVLTSRDMREGIAHPVNAAALPGGFKHAGNAALMPVWASLITSLTPPRPRARRDRRNSVQNVSASDGPMPKPMISRRPSVLAATAIIAGTGTIRPPWRSTPMIWASAKRLFFIGISSPILPRKFYVHIPLAMGRITEAGPHKFAVKAQNTWEVLVENRCQQVKYALILLRADLFRGQYPSLQRGQNEDQSITLWRCDGAFRGWYCVG